MSNIYKLKYTGENFDKALSDVNFHSSIFTTNDIVVEYNTPPKDVCGIVVKQLATKTKMVSSAHTEQIQSTGTSFAEMDYKNKEFYILYNGIKYKINTGDEIYDSQSSFVTALSDKIMDVIGDSQIKVVQSTISGKTTFRFVDDTNLGLPFYLISADDPSEDLLSVIGIPNNSTQKLLFSKKLENFLRSGFDTDGNTSAIINGKTFIFHKTQTIQDAIDAINNDEEADVTFRFSPNRCFYLERKIYGAKQLTIGGVRQFWSAFKLSMAGTPTLGQNAIINFITPYGETGDIELTDNYFMYNGNKINFYSANAEKTNIIMI